MGQSELGLCGRFALFHIVDSNSKKFYLCKILDAKVGYLLLQGWSLHKNKKLLELPALYPISLIAVGKNRTPWNTMWFDKEYLEENGPYHFSQLFPDWKSAIKEYELEMSSKE
ncbi:MAG: hypothetical protein ABJL57_06680 [Hyphomonas sp.]|uniref:hypothetical protein n=1 Tax=Hyphomonas sp. TaxID=87 RepID=UPI00326358F5